MATAKTLDIDIPRMPAAKARRPQHMPLPQLVVREAKPELCITHTPGCMLISDRYSRDVSLNWSA